MFLIKIDEQVKKQDVRIRLKMMLSLLMQRMVTLLLGPEMVNLDLKDLILRWLPQVITLKVHFGFMQMKTLNLTQRILR